MAAQKKHHIPNNIHIALYIVVIVGVVALYGSSFEFNQITGFAASGNSLLNISVGNTAPVIQIISVESTYSVTESGATNAVLSFTASDLNGASDLGATAGNVSFNRSGEATRENTSCSAEANPNGTTRNYSCIVPIQYYDEAGVWTVTVGVTDGTATAVEVDEFSINSDTCLVMGPSPLTWTSVSLGATNQTSNNQPVVINNTCNGEISVNDTNITGYDLVGEETTTEGVAAENFTINIVTSGAKTECVSTVNSGNDIINATALPINGSELANGNNSLNYGNVTSGQEQLYFCWRSVQSEGLSVQSYASLITWQVAV